ncbi:MAG: oligoendopeptidase [Bacteroidetes bacterium OLB11]|nr:MAG: oligoendopeptidase [Bacteroidetes bacterium OLB11]
MTYNADIQKKDRNFVHKDFQLSDWNTLEPYFVQLKNREITSKENLVQWLKDYSELQEVISEDVCWKQIRMTCDTENKQYEEDYTVFCMEIEPHIKPYADILNKKLIQSEHLKQLDSSTYALLIKNVENEILLFNEKNIPLQAELNILSQQYGTITGKMSVHIEGKDYTLQQAAKFLMQSNRALRKEVYLKINERRLKDKDSLNKLFDKLLSIRNQIALNAGFENYRDYKFQELRRYDYSVKECEAFHLAIKKYMTPLVEKIYELKKNQLQLNTLAPYDIDAEPEGQNPLEPFENGKELLEKSIQTFTQVRPFFGDCLKKMNELNHFDLESRKGKAPGGYNCPLAESGAPFIFMNAAGTADDVVTMMHEGGHAIHSFLCHQLELSAFKEYPMEMAELASMSMELFSMDMWNIFYPDSQKLKRAKLEELERVLSIFPWIATIDKFQHWLYTHPNHSIEERTNEWLTIYDEFAPKNISWENLENYKRSFMAKAITSF